MRRLVNRALDVAVPLWVALWIALGAVIADELRTLTELTGTVGRVGTAAREVGGGRDGLSGLPLIGDGLFDPAHAIEQAGASAEASSRASVRTASTLLGVAIATCRHDSASPATAAHCARRCARPGMTRAWTDYVPIAAAVLLISLGSDYNVFPRRAHLAGSLRTLRPRGGHRGRQPSRHLDHVAGIVLGLSFALLAIVPIQAFRELAVCMAVGVVLDAFIVRTLLVPALIALVGEHSAWPGRGLRAKSPGT